MNLNKVVYIVGCTIYSLIAITGAIGSSYFEVGGVDKILNRNWLLIAFLSLLAGSTAYYYFPKVFPKGYYSQKRIGRILLPVLFFSLSFFFTINIFKFINANLGHQRRIEISGKIEKKFSKRGSKGNRSYYLGLQDSASGQYYEFHVKKRVYEDIGEIGDTVRKIFFIGSLGAIYKNDL